MKLPNDYMIGQRIIYQNVICVVCVAQNGSATYDAIWIDNPKDGHKQWVKIHHIKPLPNGQL